MTNQNDEVSFILVQFFLEDSISEEPKVHPKKREKRQGALLKELDDLIRSYEEIDPEIDVQPYKEAAKVVRSIRGKEAYMSFIDRLLRPYM